MLARSPVSRANSTIDGAAIGEAHRSTGGAGVTPGVAQRYRHRLLLWVLTGSHQFLDVPGNRVAATAWGEWH